MNSTAYGERNAITAGTKTRGISRGRWPTSTVSHLSVSDLGAMRSASCRTVLWLSHICSRTLPLDLHCRLGIEPATRVRYRSMRFATRVIVTENPGISAVNFDSFLFLDWAVRF